MVVFVDFIHYANICTQVKIAADTENVLPHAHQRLLTSCHWPRSITMSNDLILQNLQRDSVGREYRSANRHTALLRCVRLLALLHPSARRLRDQPYAVNVKGKREKTLLVIGYCQYNLVVLRWFHWEGMEKSERSIHTTTVAELQKWTRGVNFSKIFQKFVRWLWVIITLLQAEN